MEIVRSSKCSLKFATDQKRKELKQVLSEYGRVVNIFIDHFWINGTVSKGKLLKPVVDIPKTWLSARLRKVAAREALDMISSVKKVSKSNREQIEQSIKMLSSKIKKTLPLTKRDRRSLNNWHIKVKKCHNKLRDFSPSKPIHQGKRMTVSCTIAELQKSDSKEFDGWLHLASIGNKVILDLPIKFHKQFNELSECCKRLNAYIITEDYVQFAFEQETGPKKVINKALGVDTGINALASFSNGKQLGLDIKKNIERVKRCKWGSNGHKRAQRALKQRIDEVAKETISQGYDLIVVEKLKDLNKLSKVTRRVTGNIRRSIGSWNYRYWLMRLESCCERNRVSFRTVHPAYTSQKCFNCGYTSRSNRHGEVFQCQECESTGNADINAACNILDRFLSGPYGAAYKPK